MKDDYPEVEIKNPPKAGNPHKTPLLDQLESGPWPSFIDDLKIEAKRRNTMSDKTFEKLEKLCADCPAWSGTDCILPCPEFGCVKKTYDVALELVSLIRKKPNARCFKIDEHVSALEHALRGYGK